MPSWNCYPPNNDLGAVVAEKVLDPIIGHNGDVARTNLGGADQDEAA